MQAYNRWFRPSTVALIILFCASYSSADTRRSLLARASESPSSGVACYFVGRALLNSNGQGQAVGYFTDITGVGASDSLFNGSPSEKTAFFTFRSDVFSGTPLPPNGDIALLLVSSGTFNIYFNPKPDGDWSNPDSFSGDQRTTSQPIAQFRRPETLVLQILQSDSTAPPPFESVTLHALTGKLASSQSFTFKGHKYDFGDLAPAGLTLYESASNTGVPGVAGFPIGQAYAGHCLGVVDEDMQ